MKTIVCIGDSIVEGEGDASGFDGWVGRLRDRLDFNHGADAPGWRVFNLGVGGDTIRDIGYRLGELLIRGPHIVVLGCATNDVARYTEPTGEQPKMSDSHRLKYWPLVVEKLKAICPQLLVTPGMYIEEDFINEDGGGVRKALLDDHIKFIGQTAKAHQAEFVELDDSFGSKKLRAHGVHWNEAGYDKLANLIIDKLDDLSWLKEGK